MSDPQYMLWLTSMKGEFMSYSYANYADLADWDYPDNWLDVPEDFEDESDFESDGYHMQEDAYLDSYWESLTEM